MEMNQKEEQKAESRELRIIRPEFRYDAQTEPIHIQTKIEYIVVWIDGCEAHTSVMPTKKDSTLVWEETLSIAPISKCQRQLQLSLVGDGNKLLDIRTKISFASQKKTIIIQEENIRGTLKFTTQVKKTEYKHHEISLPSEVIPSELSMALIAVQHQTIVESDLDLIDDLDVQSMRSSRMGTNTQQTNRRPQARKMSMKVETRRPSIWALQKAELHTLKIYQAIDKGCLEPNKLNLESGQKELIEEEEGNKTESQSSDSSSGPIELFAQNAEPKGLSKQVQVTEQETARQTLCQATPNPISSAKVIEWPITSLNFPDNLGFAQVGQQNQWLKMEQLTDFVRVRTQSYHIFTNSIMEPVRQRKIKIRPKTTQLKLRSRVVSEFSGSQARHMQNSSKTSFGYADVQDAQPAISAVTACQVPQKKNFQFQKIEPQNSNLFSVFHDEMEPLHNQPRPTQEIKNCSALADDDSKDMAISVRLELARMRNRVFKNLADEMTKSDKQRDQRQSTDHQAKPQVLPIKNHITGKRQPGTLNSFISSNRPLINPDLFDKEELGNSSIVKKFTNKKKLGATMQSAVQLYGSGACSPNRHPFGDKIYENQSATTLQKSVLCYSMSKAQRFGKGQQKTFESTYFTGSCFQFDKSKGTSFGFGTRKPYPSWLERNMKEYPGPNSYQEDQALSPKEAGKGYSFGLPYRYYEKAGIFQAQPAKKSPNVQKTMGRVKSKNNLFQLSMRQQPTHSPPSNYHYRSRLQPVCIAPPR